MCYWNLGNALQARRPQYESREWWIFIKVCVRISSCLKSANYVIVLHQVSVLCVKMISMLKLHIQYVCSSRGGQRKWEGWGCLQDSGLDMLPARDESLTDSLLICIPCCLYSSQTLNCKFEGLLLFTSRWVSFSPYSLFPFCHGGWGVGVREREREERGGKQGRQGEKEKQDQGVEHTRWDNN